MHCMFRSNVGDINMTSLMSYRTNIMRTMYIGVQNLLQKIEDQFNVNYEG